MREVWVVCVCDKNYKVLETLLLSKTWNKKKGHKENDDKFQIGWYLQHKKSHQIIKREQKHHTTPDLRQDIWLPLETPPYKQVDITPQGFPAFSSTLEICHSTWSLWLIANLSGKTRFIIYNYIYLILHKKQSFHCEKWKKGKTSST